MPGIAGIIGRFFEMNAILLQSMVKCMNRESFYVSGTLHRRTDRAIDRMDMP